VLRAKGKSRLPLNFARKLLQNGVSLWFEPVISDASATLAVGSASYSFSGKQDNQQKSAEATSFTESGQQEAGVQSNSQVQSLQLKQNATLKKLPLIVTTV
jgi:hypothetical protein